MDKQSWTVPHGHTDPVADVDLPHITAYDWEDPDPIPPGDRLAAEPADVVVREDV